jgi:molybdate transport system regulatory protein
VSDAQLKIRITFGARGMMGPGKADLLEGIAETGSISAAGRRMGMSYKRAWSLVETMNAMFAAPLVAATRGGAAGGGAHLTEAGAAVLAEYRALQATADRALGDHVRAFEACLRDMSDRK